MKKFTTSRRRPLSSEQTTVETHSRTDSSRRVRATTSDLEATRDSANPQPRGQFDAPTRSFAMYAVIGVMNSQHHSVWVGVRRTQFSR